MKSVTVYCPSKRLCEARKSEWGVTKSSSLSTKCRKLSNLRPHQLLKLNNGTHRRSFTNQKQHSACKPRKASSRNRDSGQGYLLYLTRHPLMNGIKSHQWQLLGSHPSSKHWRISLTLGVTAIWTLITSHLPKKDTATCLKRCKGPNIHNRWQSINRRDPSAAHK